MPFLLAHSVFVGKVILWVSAAILLYGACWVLILKRNLQFKSLIVGVVCYCIPAGLLLAVACQSKKGRNSALLLVLGLLGIWWAQENLDDDPNPRKAFRGGKLVELSNLQRLLPMSDDRLRETNTRDAISGAQKRKLLLQSRFAASGENPAAQPAAVADAVKSPIPTAPSPFSASAQTSPSPASAAAPGTAPAPAAPPVANSKAAPPKSPAHEQAKELAAKKRKKAVEFGQGDNWVDGRK